MKYVIIYTLNSEAKQTESARCGFKDGKITCSGNKTIINNLNELGVFDKKADKSIFPKDGEKFLDTLVDQFNSPYLFVSEILND